MSESINARFKRLRIDNGLSQKEMGERLGLKQGAVSRLEQEGHTITEASMKLLETAFGVNIEWLKTGRGEMYNKSSEDGLEKIADQLQLTDIQKKVFLTLMGLPDDRREIIAKAFWTIYNAGRGDDELKKR